MIIRSSLSVTLLTAISCPVFWVTLMVVTLSASVGHPVHIFTVFRIHQIASFPYPCSLTTSMVRSLSPLLCRTIPTTSSSSPARCTPLTPAAVRPIGRTFSSGKPDGPARLHPHRDLAMAVREFHFQQFIAFIDGDGLPFACPGAFTRLQSGFLIIPFLVQNTRKWLLRNSSSFRSGTSHIGHDLVAGWQTDHILNGPSFGGPVTFRESDIPAARTLALLRKEQHGVMGTGDQNMFYKILITGCNSRKPLPPLP